MEAGWRQPLTDAEVARLALDMDQQGYGVLRNYVPDSELKSAHALAITAVDATGGEYAGFTGSDALAGTVLGDLPQSPAFRNLCQRLYQFRTVQSAPEVQFYQIFRCLQGSTGQRHSYRFHYDSYIVTALLPVAIPETGARGDLLIIPKSRPIRRLYVANVLDKIFVDNAFAQKRFRRVSSHRSSIVTIRMQPGDMYFFWGYQSIHTNKPSDPDKLRATALFHYGDPHRKSPTRALVRRVTAHAKRFHQSLTGARTSST